MTLLSFLKWMPVGQHLELFAYFCEVNGGELELVDPPKTGSHFERQKEKKKTSLNTLIQADNTTCLLN